MPCAKPGITVSLQFATSALEKMCFEGFWGRNQGPWLWLQITKLWNMAGGLALNPELELVSRGFWLWVWLHTVSVFCYSELLKRGEALATEQRPLGTLLWCWMEAWGQAFRMTSLVISSGMLSKPAFSRPESLPPPQPAVGSGPQAAWADPMG